MLITEKMRKMKKVRGLKVFLKIKVGDREISQRVEILEHKINTLSLISGSPKVLGVLFSDLYTHTQKIIGQQIDLKPKK